MPRQLSDQPCTLEIFDKISSSILTIYYRLPETTERVAYVNEHVSRKGRKFKTAIAEPKVKWGKKIITGFGDGDFTIPGPDGKDKPIASDPASPNYDAKWKDHVEKYAADILMALAAHVFDSAAPEEAQEPEDEGGEDEQERDPS